MEYHDEHDHHNHSDNHDEPFHVHDHHQSILMAKAITMVVLCLVSICVGLIPIELAKCLKWDYFSKSSNSKSSKFVGLLLGFGGGVLFCTTFVHILPELQENVQILIKKKKLPSDLNFPLAEVMICIGFFIMYLVEEIVHSKLHKKEKDLNVNVTFHAKKDADHDTNHSHGNDEPVCSIENSHRYGHGHSHVPSAVDIDRDNFVVSSLRGLLIVLGMSVHELFEGLAIGLEGSANHVWYMFAAVAAHKFVIAFCIGVELLASKTHRWLSVIYICIFAIVSPAGIGIGMILVGGESTAANGVVPVVLQGIATGTLLYVVFFEILHHNRDGFGQYLSIFLGFLLMLGLQIATLHSHSHSHFHHHGHGHGHGHEHSHKPTDATMMNSTTSSSLLLNSTGTL